MIIVMLNVGKFWEFRVSVSISEVPLFHSIFLSTDMQMASSMINLTTSLVAKSKVFVKW